MASSTAPDPNTPAGSDLETAAESPAPADPTHERGPGHRRSRLWVLAPVLLLALAIVLVARNGDTLIEALGHTPPPADEFAISRVDFVDEQVRIHVTNPQRDELRIAAVSVDNAFVPFTVEDDESRTIGRLGTRTLVVPYTWVEDDPYLIGLTSNSGIETTHEVPAAVEREGVTSRGLFAGALLGLLVGVLPVGLGLAWLPSLRNISNEWLVAFMSLTAGLLVFVALDAFVEALELQAALPDALSGTGAVLLGIATSFLGIWWIANRAPTTDTDDAISDNGVADQRGYVAPATLALLVAAGIGLHNLGEGLAIGSSFSLGALSLGVFLVVGFMVHNITEGLAIAVPASRAGQKVRIGRLVLLGLLAGLPTIAGVWLGRYVTNDLVAVLFFSFAVGAALQVVVEVLRYVRAHSRGGLLSGYSVGGFLVGIVVMYATGLLVG